jgi:hypothetical protein
VSDLVARTIYLPPEEIRELEGEAAEAGRSGISAQIRFLLGRRRGGHVIDHAVYTEAVGHLSAELAARSGAWEGKAPDWFPQPQEWLELSEAALAAVRPPGG